ncbi:lysylphosphatidylglycerol synthase transmembrane domain-containing protein [Thermodesulfobacteriota bacterium]
MKLSARLKNSGLLALKFGITITILYYIFTKIPIAEVARSISLARPLYIVGALAIAILATYISACRLKILTDRQGMSLTISRITEINFLTSFYGLLLPGYLASGVMRWHRLSQAENKKTEALAAIAFSRLIYTISSIVIAITFLSFDVQHRVGGIKISILLSLLFCLVMIYFIGFNPNLLPIVDRFNQGKEKSISVWLSSKISKLLLATSKYNRLSSKIWGLIAGFTILESLLEILSVYLFTLALDINISYISIGWVISILKLVTALPISFSGLGIREGGLIVLLGPYGVFGSEAVALSFLIFAKILFIGGIGAIAEAKNFFYPAKPWDMKT